MLVSQNQKNILAGLALGSLSLGALVLNADNMESQKHAINAHNHSHNHSDEPVVSGSIGIYGKTSSFASNYEDGRFKRDSYSMLYSEFLVTGRTLDHIDVGIGVVAYAPFDLYTAYDRPEDSDEPYDPKTNSVKEQYIGTNFVAHIAYLGFNRNFGGNKVSIRAGRFDEHNFDWLGHAIQGAGAHIQNNYFKLYATWANEQAHITRGVSTDFDFYKGTYAKNDLFALGADFYFPYLQISPHFYRMTKVFDVFGAKAVLSLGDTNGWHFETLYSYSRLNALKFGFGDSDTDEEDHIGPSHFTSPKGTGATFFSWVQASAAYKNDFEIGLGYSKVGDHYFELARMESPVRLEHSHGRMMTPGGIHGGSQLTNMYLEKVETIYAFLNFKISDLEIELTGRKSSDYDKYKQDAASIGFRYTFFYDFEIGAIAVYMKSNYSISDESLPMLNRSYGRAYFQYSF